MEAAASDTCAVLRRRVSRRRPVHWSSGTKCLLGICVGGLRGTPHHPRRRLPGTPSSRSHPAPHWIADRGRPAPYSRKSRPPRLRTSGQQLPRREASVLSWPPNETTRSPASDVSGLTLLQPVQRLVLVEESAASRAVLVEVALDLQASDVRAGEHRHAPEALAHTRALLAHDGFEGGVVAAARDPHVLDQRVLGAA